MKTRNLGDFVVILNNADDVATAVKDIAPGKYILCHNDHDCIIDVKQKVKAGFKIALRKISKGLPIHKFGQPIGIAKINVEQGTVVHIHNLKSRLKPND